MNVGHIIAEFRDQVRGLLASAPPPHVAECGCCPARNIECDKAQALGDDASRKFQSYHAAKDTVFRDAAKHTWDRARSRYLKHLEEARVCGSAG